MRAALVALAASLAFGGSAVAAERAHGKDCQKISDLKAELDKTKDKLETLGPGAFHLAEGIWMATPPATLTQPNFDAALIFTTKGEKGGVLIFTRGKEGCLATPPLPIPPQLVQVLSAVKTGDGEKAEPSGDELRL